MPPTDPAAVRPMAERARAAARALAPLPLASRNAALCRIADALERSTDQLLAANDLDLDLAGRLVDAGELSAANFARLPLSAPKLAEMAAQVRAVRELPDPLGRTLDAIELDRGLHLEKRSVPLGVLAVIFEARPDAVTQIAALALKSGNAVLLKPGREVEHTAHALVTLIRQAIATEPPAPNPVLPTEISAPESVLSTGAKLPQSVISTGAQRSGETCSSPATDPPTLPADAVQLLLGREAVAELLTLSALVDLVIPRGTRALVEHIQATTRIPVLGHADGICHVYVDQHADLAQALAVVDDAKTDYPAVCNAAETCLIHEAIAAQFLPALITRLSAKGVHFRADQPVRDLLNSSIGNFPQNLSPTQDPVISTAALTQTGVTSIAASSQDGVISTEAKRSGETCGPAATTLDPSPEALTQNSVLSTEGDAPQRPSGETCSSATTALSTAAPVPQSAVTATATPNPNPITSTETETPKPNSATPNPNPATSTDIPDPDSWHTEYGDLTLALRIVPSLAAAIDHIHRHGSAHTETICTTDPAAAERFLNEVDAASVMLNASTRFADGFRYGLGAEVGVSTSRIHARGPVGLEGLTTTKFVLRGEGHRAADYHGPNARPFTHTRKSRP